MKMIQGFCGIILMLSAVVTAAGCRTTAGNTGQVQSFSFQAIEPAWIRNGEPIEFENEAWYPKDSTENLLDSEVYQVGVYKDVQFFVDKVDVRPFDRLYTKFSRNKFRSFEKKTP